MDNVTELRKNQPFLVGQKVLLGECPFEFTVKALGYCGPIDAISHEGELVNGSEFVQLIVPGLIDRVFNVHKSYLQLVPFKFEHGHMACPNPRSMIFCLFCETTLLTLDGRCTNEKCGAYVKT